MNGSLTKHAGRTPVHARRSYSVVRVAVVGLVVAQTGPPTWASDAIETAGDVLAVVLPAASAGVGLWQRDWDGLLHFGYSLGSGFALTEGTKALVDRERPDLLDIAVQINHAAGRVAPVGHHELSVLRDLCEWPGLPAAFVVNSFVILALMSSRHSCSECPQKHDCPWMARVKGSS